MTDAPLRRTPLHGLHLSLGAKMVPFAGYEMPLQYEGIMAEHRHVREQVGFFDVSHMGQARYVGNEGALEALITADLMALGAGEQKYSLLLNDRGGIMDDLMLSRPDGEGVFLVVNAATKAADFAHIAHATQGEGTLTVIADRALMALQGPAAKDVMAELSPSVNALVFMQAGEFTIAGANALVSRSGYTGEDGFEISVPAVEAERVAKAVLAHSAVKPIGLGARDSLRLEAGLCLYGHDMDETRTPVEAALMWAVPKSRRERADFPGADVILKQLAGGPARKRVGFTMSGAPAREGAVVTKDGREIGVVTSGGFGPTVGGPVGMAYVDAGFAAAGTDIEIIVRDTARPALVAKTPFTPQRYHRG